MATAPVYIVDTHPLVWYLTASSRLSSTAVQVFDEIDRGNALGIVPTIVLAEIMHLSDRKKIPISITETIAQLQRSTSFGIVSLDLMIIHLMIPLKSYELHDRVIVATAKSFAGSLITKDEHIRNSGTVPCIW